MATEKAITPLKMLSTDLFRPTIKGRITKLWTAQNPKEKTVFSYDFIFVDQQNTAMEGYISIKDPFANELLEQLEEGHVYELFKFNPVKERENFKTVECTNGLRIQVTSATTITKVKEDDASFQLRYFNFKQLGDIGTVIKKDKSVVDLIGQITSARLKKIGATNVVDITIENESNEKATISIWEDCLSQINFDKIEQQSKTQHVVLAFSSIQIQEFKGYSFTSHSLKSYSATRIYQDESIPEIRDFLSRIAQKKIQPITNPAPALQEEVNKTPRTYVSIKNVQQLCTANNEDKLFDVVAEIVEVLDEHGWYYLSCPIHRNRVTTINNSFYCLGCEAELEEPLPWLNFCIRVQDSTGEANFVLIGKMGEKLLGNTAQELLTQQTNKRELPPKFNELQKQKKLFTVTWGKKKFKVAFPYYQVLQVNSVPATSHSILEIEEPKAQPGTPPDDNQKNSSEQELKITATAQKRKAKELFLEQPSTKIQTRTGTSKGIEIKKEKE